jgi:lysophospholipase L1-like esterase
MTNAIQIKRDTAANWTAANTLLLSGQEGLETDTGARKIGDGSTAWNALAYFTTTPTAAGGLVKTGAAATPSYAQKSKVFADSEVTPQYALNNYRQAKIRAMQGGRPCIVLINGDSTAGSTNSKVGAVAAGNISGNARMYALSASLAKLMSANGVPATDSGVVGTWNSSIGSTGASVAFPSTDLRCAYGSGWGNSDTAGTGANFGGGYHAMAAGATGTFDISFQTPFDTIVVGAAQIGGGAVFNVLVDGTSVGTITDSGAGTSAKEVTFTVPAGLLANHKISIGNGGSVAGGIGYVYVYNSLNPGVLILTNSISGGVVQQFLSTSGTLAQENTGYGLAPDLVIVDLTINDMGAGLAAATWQTRMESLLAFYNRQIAKTGANYNCDAILCGLSPTTNANYATLVAGYAAAMQALSVAGTRTYGPINVVDWRVPMGATGTAAVAAGTLYGTDGTHPMPLGYGLRAKYILPLLLQ